MADRSLPPPHTHLTHTALAVITQYIPTRAISPYQHVGLEFLVSDCTAGKLLFMIQSEERTSWSQVCVGGGGMAARQLLTTLADSLPADASVEVYC